MSSTSEPAHLSNHHRNTLRQIFEHPVSHNVEWRNVVSLLEAVGSVAEHHDGKVAVTVGSQNAYLDPPGQKDIDIQTVVDLRRMLSAAGYGPASKDVLLWLTRSSARTSRIGRCPGPCGLAGGAPLPTPALRRSRVRSLSSPLMWPSGNRWRRLPGRRQFFALRPNRDVALV